MDSNVMPMKPDMPTNPMEVLLNKAEKERSKLVEQLEAKIPRSVISKRDGGGGRKLDYLEGWYVIDRMNQIFGVGGWSYVTDEMRLVHQGEVDGKHVAHYVAKITVRAAGTAFSDFGYGDGTDKYNPGKAHELAVKEAVTDAIKRACKNFGKSMGLALYDKTREFVDEEEQSSVGTGDTKRTQANASTGSKDAAATTAPQASGSGDVVAGGSTGKTSLVAKAKNRDELNSLITGAARTAVAKKVYADMAAIKKFMLDTYGTDKKEAMTDAQATAFLNKLDIEINGGTT